MYSTSVIKLLVVALSASSAAQAFYFEPRFVEKDNGMIKRQGGSASASGTAASPTADADSTTTSAAPTTTSSTTEDEPTTTSAPTTTSRAATTTTTSQRVPSTTSSAPSATTRPTTEPTSAPSSTSLSVEPSTSTFVVVTTAEDGSTTSFTSEVTTTPTASLSGDGDSGGESGMSTQTRNTIIGVVVGVGGAIILVVLGVVAYRIWGRKKSEENDGLMDYNGGYNEGAKSEAGGSAAASGRSPFQSTLESYHAPSQVNASSNF